MQPVPLRLASFLGLSLLLATAGCGGHDGLGGPDGGAGKTGHAGTTGTGTGEAGSTSTGTGSAGSTGTGTGTAGSTGAAGTTGTTGAAGVSGAAGTSGTGKAGTGGIMCGPVCAIFCQYGNVVDANGCPTCKCNPAPVCTVADCGPQPGTTGAGATAPALVPVPVCSTGAAYTCARDAAGKCSWLAVPGPMQPPCSLKCAYGYKTGPNGCPTCECNPAPVACTTTECGPGPKVPSQMCSDGTVAGPVCSRNAAGTCGWTITQCPPPVCPAVKCFAACPYGYRTDANGCQTCQCIEPASCATFTDYKTCVSDMRCTWLQPGCGMPALATPGCYALTDVGCTGDGSCTGGRTCLKRFVNPCYNPTGGVTCDACGAVQTVCL